MRPMNRWYAAILDQLGRANGDPLTTDQIWAAMEAAGFQHASQNPRSTLGARLAELGRMERITRVGRSTFRLVPASADTRTATERFRAGEGVPLEDFVKQGSFPRLAPKGIAS